MISRGLREQIQLPDASGKGILFLVVSGAMRINSDVLNTIEIIVDKLVEEYQPEKIILFGSYAYGEPDSGSDLDFLIIKQTSKRLIDRWTEVRRILTDHRRMIPIDTFVLTPSEIAERLGVGDQYVEEILRRGKVLYDAQRVTVPA